MALLWKGKKYIWLLYWFFYSLTVCTVFRYRIWLRLGRRFCYIRITYFIRLRLRKNSNSKVDDIFYDNFRGNDKCCPSMSSIFSYRDKYRKPYWLSNFKSYQTVHLMNVSIM